MQEQNYRKYLTQPNNCYVNRLLFNLGPKEKESLSILSNLVEALPDAVIEEFFTFIKGSYTFKKEEIPHYKTSIKTFLVNFFLNPFSEKIFEKSFRIGIVHAERGVGLSLFLSGLFKLESLFRKYIRNRIEDQALQENLIQLALNLLFYLATVVIDAYYQRLNEGLQEANTEITRLNRIYVLLREMNLLIFEERNSPEKLFREASEILVREGEFDLAWIGLIDPKTKEVKPVAAAGKTECLDGYFVSIDPDIAEGRGPWGEAFRTGRPGIVQNTEKDPRFEPWRDKVQSCGLRSVIVLPLVLENKIRGGISLYHSKPQYFTSKEVQLLSEISRDLSLGWMHIENRQELERALFIDEITGLKNERYLIDVLEPVLKVVKEQKQRLALVQLDVKGFSLINHRFGRAAGDQVLKEAGQRLVNLVGDRGTVARTGADDFSCSYIFEQDSELKTLLSKIKNAFSIPINFGEKTTQVSASIGIALFPKDASSPQKLLEVASVALKKAKEKPLWGVACYSKEETQNILSRWHLVEELERAYERKEFVLFFQPRVDLISWKISCFEALLRWQHPEKGLISPAEFIPALEESGLITRVGRWVIKESAHFLKKLLSNYPEIGISFNVSVKQIQNGDLVETLKKILEEDAVPPERLEVEITESLLLEAQKTIEKIHELGLKLAIDDFGTGYSSFGYLRKIPTSIVKIDYSFVRGLPEGREDASVVMAIVAMLKSLGKKTVAEGVERRDQLSFLMGLGVDEIQGYYFARPMPEDDVLTFLRNFKPEKYS